MLDSYYAVREGAQAGSAVEIDVKQAAANVRESGKPVSGTYEGMPPASAPPPQRPISLASQNRQT